MTKLSPCVYQVVKLRGQWHVHIPGSGIGVHPSQEKSYIVEWACEHAARTDGIVHVRDAGGRVEAVFEYKNGVKHEAVIA